MKAIIELAVGEVVSGHFLLKRSEVKATRTNPPKIYLDLTFADSTGEISGKLWDATEADIEEFNSIQVVYLNGMVQSYQDKLQIKITTLSKLDEGVDVPIRKFIRSAPKTEAVLMETIRKTAAGIYNNDIRHIVEYCINKVADKFKEWPAAKSNHHAYYSGLAYHTCRMLEIGKFVCEQRHFLNPDFVEAGIILHDIAKTEEMIAELGIVSDYSLRGKLIGHISLASLWIAEAAAALQIPPESEVVLALHHIVLSHHNLGDWGSPVQPQIPEAVALHLIDQLDAKLQAVEDALATTPVGEKWTQRIPVIEHKAIYRLNVND